MLIAASSAAQTTSPPSGGYATVVEVVARTVAFDVVDAQGRPVKTLEAGLVRVLEDGVERQVLAVELRASSTTVPATAPFVPRAPSVAPSHVLVALDPTTLGPREWREAVDRLAGVADALVALGPVDVVALTAPPRAFAAASRDAAEVRAALAAAGAEVPAEDGLYGPRLRFLREVQAIMAGGPTMPTLRPLPPDAGPDALPSGGHDPAVHRRMLIDWLRGETLVLKAEEERTLRLALDRLQSAFAGVPRPTVVVWVAGGEPFSAEFVRSLLPPGAATQADQEILGLAQTTAFWSELDDVWRSWEQAGVRVVAWGPARVDEVDLGTADARLPMTSYPDQPRRRLSSDPLALLGAAAAATGGVLVQDPEHIADLIGSVAGRFVVTYQTDTPAGGWRELRIEVARNGWVVRHPRRVLVPEPAPLPRVAPAPVVLAVRLAAERYPSEQPGRELVKLPVVVELDPLRAALAPGTPARFVFRIFATPPGAETLVRDVDVNLGAMPVAGNLRYEPSLVVPRGTGAFAVEVHEAGSGAIGVAGPVEAVGDAGSGGVTAAEGTAAAPAGAFSESQEVRIAEARFLGPKGTAGEPTGVRVLWQGRQQALLRVAGGAGSSLELGIAFDISESATDEREAFAGAAVAAASRLLGDGDRLFRVDFGAVPRFRGAARSGPGELLAELPVGVPEKTAIFDALAFALDRFARQSDRRALVVFTDGCETAGTTTWEEVERRARALAIPIFVVLADGDGCAGAPDIVVPQSAAITSVSRVAAPGQPAQETREAIAGSRSEALRAGGREGTSREHLRRLAADSGGMVVPMRRAGRAGDAWEEVEAALGRLWVAVFEPSDPALDAREVEVRSDAGRLLRPRS